MERAGLVRKPYGNAAGDPKEEVVVTREARRGSPGHTSPEKAGVGTMGSLRRRRLRMKTTSKLRRQRERRVRTVASSGHSLTFLLTSRFLLHSLASQQPATRLLLLLLLLPERIEPLKSQGCPADISTSTPHRLP